jgi:hypothetical protein
MTTRKYDLLNMSVDKAAAVAAVGSATLVVSDAPPFPVRWAANRDGFRLGGKYAADSVYLYDEAGRHISHDHGGLGSAHRFSAYAPVCRAIAERLN